MAVTVDVEKTVVSIILAMLAIPDAGVIIVMVINQDIYLLLCKNIRV